MTICRRIICIEADISQPFGRKKKLSSQMRRTLSAFGLFYADIFSTIKIFTYYLLTKEFIGVILKSKKVKVKF